MNPEFLNPPPLSAGRDEMEWSGVEWNGLWSPGRKEGGREVVGKQEEIRCGVVSDSFFIHFTCRPPNLPYLLRRIIFNKYVHRQQQRESQSERAHHKHFVSTYLLITYKMVDDHTRYRRYYIGTTAGIGTYFIRR